jgi:hypothetical protein
MSCGFCWKVHLAFNLMGVIMSNLKDRLIRLGSENPELREHLKPVIDKLSGKIHEMPESLERAMMGKAGKWDHVPYITPDDVRAWKDVKKFISSLDRYTFDEVYEKPHTANDTFAKFDGKVDPPQVFVLEHARKGRKYVIDTSGYDYPRYSVQVSNDFLN